MMKDKFNKFKKKLKLILKKKYFDLLEKNVSFNKDIKSNYDKYKNTYLDLIIKKREDYKEIFYKLFKTDYLNQSIRTFGHKKYFANLTIFVNKSNSFLKEKILINLFNNLKQKNLSSVITGMSLGKLCGIMLA